MARARPVGVVATVTSCALGLCATAASAGDRSGPPCNAACAGDLDFDGDIDGADLGLFLVDWGVESGSCADLDSDGSVDGADLSMMLGGWGVCAAAACDEQEWLPGFGPVGVNNLVRALTVFDDGDGPALFAGGFFTQVGGVFAKHIARWNGVQWSALGGGMDNWVEALVVHDDGNGEGPMLYAGGWFTTAGGTPANRIARWDGISWSAVGEGVDDQVRALAVFDDGTGPALYAGGVFRTAGGIEANRIAKWDGSSWSALGSGLNDQVRALAVFDDGSGPALYAGGWFTTAGGAPANHIAKWDGISWTAVGDGMLGAMEPTVLALTVFDDGRGGGPALYAGGNFTTAGASDAHGIARWDGASWSPVGAGVDGTVYAIAPFDDGGSGTPALYVGGWFTTAGNTPASNIARWDGVLWSAVDAGIAGGEAPHVLALAEFDEDGASSLYVGGSYPFAGDVTASNLARWDGVSWSAIGAGAGNTVSMLAVIDEGGTPALYAGGLFLGAGGIHETDHIAKWDGTSWSSVGGGITGLTVHDVAMFDDGAGGGPALYVGGKFTEAGGVAADNIARWDGVSWSAVGGGTNASVQALAVYDDGGGPALYAAGSFTSAGGVPAKWIARWDGKSWSALGTSTNTVIHALAVFDDGSGPVLVAGGQFFTAGGLPAYFVAKWNGSSWAPVGTGTSGKVNALTVVADADGVGEVLYAGGVFLLAGGTVVNRIARWDGQTWSALGTGVSGEVMALVATDPQDGRAAALYATGFFTTAGGVEASRISRWDGSSWSPLGVGLNSYGSALAVFDDGEGNGPSLFVGGYFSMAGGIPSAKIAQWGCGSR